MSMPTQKPGRSIQSVATPPIFLQKVRELLDIETFSWDLAADEHNSVCGDCHWDEEDNSLIQEWYKVNGFQWCNPPYSDITPWVEKAYEESQKNAKVVMLVPASVGAKWWSTWVEGKAHALFLQPRLTFVGHTAPYPKDLALLLYTKYLRGGHYVWNWRT